MGEYRLVVAAYADVSAYVADTGRSATAAADGIGFVDILEHLMYDNLSGLRRFGARGFLSNFVPT